MIDSGRKQSAEYFGLHLTLVGQWNAQNNWTLSLFLFGSLKDNKDLRQYDQTGKRVLIKWSGSRQLIKEGSYAETLRTSNDDVQILMFTLTNNRQLWRF